MEEGPSRKLAVLLHADVVGSTALVQSNETLAHQRMQDTFRRFSETIASHGGITNEIRGDALVAEFSKASDAVAAAIDFQAANTDHIEQLADDIRPAVRVGIAMGEVVVADNTVTGEGIVLAQRLEQLAEPGGVCIQGAAYETVPKRLPFDYETLGECELKGFDEPVRVYAVRQTQLSDSRSAAPIRWETHVPDEPDRVSIIVLPFANMSGDPEQEYFADGLTEDIITGLSRFRELFVIARNSAFTYKGKAVNVQEVGAKLKVQFALEGSVRRSGNRLRATTQLIETATNSHVWAERYDRNMDDVFAVQDEITETVVATVVGRVGKQRINRARTSPTENLGALDQLLHARQELQLYTAESLAAARVRLTNAIELDPDYAAAHQNLSQVYWGLWWTGMTPEPSVCYERMFKHAERAVSLDDTDSRAHLQIGYVDLFRRRYDTGRFHLNKSHQLNPNDPDVPFCIAILDVFEGDGHEAIEWANRSVRMDPLGHYGYALGQAHYVAPEYPQAFAAFRSVRGGMLTAKAWLAACHVQLGEQDAAGGAATEFSDAMSNAIAATGGTPPVSWLDYFRERWPFRDKNESAHLLDALRAAGLS